MKPDTALPSAPRSPTAPSPFSAEAARHAARLLVEHWQAGRHLEALPEDCRPGDADAGRAVQAQWADACGDAVAGWKIAATSAAGQAHIAVDGPLAGPVFAARLHASGAQVSLAGNRMRVAECEVVFRLGAALGPRDQPYRRDEVLAAVAAVLPGLEIPDSRFLAFERAGMAQLIADSACTNAMVLGEPVDAAQAGERLRQLAALAVHAEVDDGRRLHGIGSNALGDPLTALEWLVEELRRTGRTLQAGQFVTTGACVTPIPVQPGQRVAADFGWLGRIAVAFARD